MHIVPAVGQKKLIELSVRDLQILYNSKTGILSARSVRLMNIILHGALEQANLLGLVNRNVMKGVVLPKEEPKEMRVLTLDEQRKLIEILKTDRYGNAYLFGLCTGLRRGELLALTWDDYDAANKTIYVNKTLNRVKNYADDGRGRTKLVITSPKTTKSRRLVPLMDLAIEALNRQREYQKADKELLDELYRDDNLIFCGEMGNIIDPGNFNRKFGKFLELAGIDGATPHTMRHSFATRGLESGISIKIMQELLGHSSINVTGNIYTHVLLETKKGEIDKLNKMFPASNGETEIE